MILNLTQHAASPEQSGAGVIDPTDHDKVRDLLTFSGLPTPFDVERRAESLAAFAYGAGADAAMIGGAPFLMAALERWLRAYDILPLYAFSRRESVEEVQADGSVQKRAVFRHIGFVGTESE